MKFDSKQNPFVFQDNMTNGSGSLLAMSCSKKELRKACIEMIIDELTFSFIEKEGFQKPISKACPKLDHFSRRIVARDMYPLHFGYIEYGSIPTV